MTTLNLTNICNRVHVAIKHSARALVTGSWLIAGTALAAPANDNFAAAIDLTGAGVGQTGDAITGNQTGTNTTAATLQASEPNPGASNTVWFKWTSPGNGNFTYGTLGSTDPVPAEWDAIIGIYTGAAVNALTPLGTTPKDTGPEETMTVPVTSGTTYYIQLAGYADTEAANILLNWNFVETIYKADILTFGPGAVVGEVFVDAATITWHVPSGTNLATLAPTFTLSPGATCNRTSGAVPSPNFSAGSVVYTVTSQGASVINYYTVTAVVGNLVKWNVAGGGDWDDSTSNWFKQPSGPVTTFAEGDEVTFDNPAGGTINIPLTVSPLSTTVSAASGSYTFSGDLLAGSGPLNKSGSGTLTLASTNSYSGATVVNGGTLTATGNGSLGGSTNFTVATGSILQLNGTAGGYRWPATPATLTGAGTVNIPLGGNTNIGNNFDMSTFTGTLNLTSTGGMMAVNPVYSPGFTAPPNGTINIGNNTTLYLGWQGTVYNTTIKLSGGTGNGEPYGVLRGDNATLNGAVILATNSTIGTAGGSLTINSVISDGGNGFGFTQVANGTVTLTAANTYTGPTTVNSGATLKCDIPNALGSGPLSISGKVNLNFVGNKTVPSLILGGVAKASGVYGSSASPAPPANQDDARFAGTGTVTVVVVAPKTVLWNVAGGGDWNLTTPNWLEQPSGPGTMFANGDTAIFSNTAGGTIIIPSTVSPLATTVSAASGSYTFSGGPLAGGSLTKSGLGSLTLASTNSYSGATVVSGGTLQVNGNSAVGGTSSFSVATGATLQLNGTNAGGYKWPAAPATLTGAGTVNIPLSGQTNVGNNFDMSAFTGNLNISGGMMGVNTVQSPGFTAPPNGAINVGNATTLYLGWTGFVLNTTVRMNSSTDNGENLGVLRASNGTLNGALILGANTTIGADPTLIINAVISDGGSGFGFTQVASGTVTLTAANTYTGPTTVNNGATLKCDTSGSLGGGALSINGMVNLNFVGNKTVASLTLGGVAKSSGVYGSSASPAPPANQDDARFAGTGTVTVAGGGDYSTWAAVYLPADVSNPAADNDGDGLTNLQEYAFGLNPTLGSSVSPITAQLDAVTGNFQYTRRATPAATGLTYTVLTSTNLVAWAAGGATETGFTTAGEIQTVTVHVTAPAVDGKLFVRVKAVPAP